MISLPPLKRGDTFYIGCVSKDSTSEYHVVLIVTTDKGDYVLDNRYPFPMERRALNYKWDKIQQGDKWYKIA